MRNHGLAVPGKALLCLLLMAFLAFGAGSSRAGDVELVLSRGPGNAETLGLTAKDLADLPQVTVVTQNEFTNGKVTFRGPLARDVLERLAIDHVDTVRFIAANDYYVDVPTSDFQKYDVILATEADGKTLSRRDKGPIWLIYPISDHPELQDPLYIKRLIWQVVRIESL